MIPAPFARLAVGHGAPQPVPAGLTEEGLETWRARLQKAHEEISEQVDRRAEGKR